MITTTQRRNQDPAGTPEEPVTAPAPGWYAVGQAGISARWDGESWTGESRQDREVTTLPRWRHHPLSVLGHRWLHLMVIGSVLCAAVGYITSSSGQRVWALLAVIPMVLFMWGVYELVDPHLRFRQLPDRSRLIAVGVLSGLCAIGAAILIEGPGEKYLGLSLSSKLWLSGPVEETLKLLVPVLLLAAGWKLVASPRAGVLVVLVSGATFGVVEATMYVHRAEEWGALAQGIARPAAELLHPFVTAFAAGVIWLAARRAGRVPTLAGAISVAVAMLVHSLHDGVATLRRDHPETLVDDAATIDTAISQGTVLLVISVVFALLCYLLLRHSARETVPPDAVSSNAAHWRPALRQWGRPRSRRPAEEAAITS